jgi:hypothetical protein
MALCHLALGAVGVAHPEICRKITKLDSVSPVPGRVRQRAKFWEGAASVYLERFGDSYLPWVLDLPPGAEREVAISATATKLKDIDPSAAERFLKAAEASHAGNR